MVWCATGFKKCPIAPITCAGAFSPIAKCFHLAIGEATTIGHRRNETMDEIVKEFLVESNENLEQLDRDLVHLESDPTNREKLASVFRTIHTVKGTAGCLGFSRLANVTHAGESLLSRLRDGTLLLNQEITSGLLAMLDVVREMLSNIEAKEQEGEGDYTELIGLLTRLQAGETAPAASANASDAKYAPETTPATAPPVAAPPPLGDLMVQIGAIVREQLATALRQQQDGDSRRIGEILVDQGAPPNAVVDALETQRDLRESAVAASTIRVDVGQLDKLMNLVGELVLVRNQILQFSAAQQDPGFQQTTQRLNLVTTELQEGVMKTRMQPIDTIWSKFPRVVRDLAMSCGKQVRLEMEGKETELDKTLIEAIKDPLTHLIRNSVDHGIESPDKRAAAGKPADGRLLLRAYHEGGQVNIEVSDDGAGVAIDRVKRKAVEHGLTSPQKAAQMSEREALDLLFLPGFSTAQKITNVSGRGVGLDVVKTNIEKIGGSVDIQSVAGKGTTIKVKIPLTLAIIPALMVATGGDRYAIPQVSLLELVRLEGEQAVKGVEMIHGAPVYRLRGRLLPLVYLKRELNVVGHVGKATRQRASVALDFSLARKKHLEWKKRLQEVLDGKLSMTEQQAGSHKECALGKWLYGQGLKEFGALSVMQEIEKAHQGFHVHVRGLLRSKASGDLRQAEEELSRVDVLSKEVVSILERVEDEVVSKYLVNIVVLQADDRQFGLVVDEINDTEEIVVKPLGKQLKGLTTFAGATIMGDGRVALILDILGLAQKARVVVEARDHGRAEKATPVCEQGEQHHTLLLLRGPNGSRMAVPLGLVSRLEEFPRSAIEHSGGQQVVQYRDEIMPLVSVAEVLAERRAITRELADSGELIPQNEKVQVVVHSDQGRNVGLVVDRILDIVDADLGKQRRATRAGTLGSVVVQGHVTELLDVDTIIRAAEPVFADQAKLEGVRA